VQKLKQSIREAEAVSGIETFGMRREQARFLNLPFYQTGKVKKDEIGPRDVKITLELLEEHRPEYIFVAGDLSDPHGTHRMCWRRCTGRWRSTRAEQPEVWYYRGAWQEWSVAEADVLVPMSEEELRTRSSRSSSTRARRTARPSRARTTASSGSGWRSGTPAPRASWTAGAARVLRDGGVRGAARAASRCSRRSSPPPSWRRRRACADATDHPGVVAEPVTG
jgi:hypothetical protein